LGGKDDDGKGGGKVGNYQKGRGGKSSLKAKTKLADNPFSRSMRSLPLAFENKP